MFKTLLAFCGYIKVPKEAILLSMEIEYGYELLSKKKVKGALRLYKSAQTITKFLRSGRLVSGL